MTEAFTPDGPRQLLTDLCRVVNERVPAEESIQSSFAARNETAERTCRETQEQLTARYRADKEAAETDYAAVRTESTARYDFEHESVQKEYDAARQAIMERFEAARTAAEEEMQEAHWDANAIAEAAKGGPNIQLEDVQAQLDIRWRELQAIHQQAVALLNRWGQWQDFADPQASAMLLERHPGRRFCHALESARPQYQSLSRLMAPRFLQGLRPMAMFFLIWAIGTVPAGIYYTWPNMEQWVPASAVGSFVTFLVLWGVCALVARRRCADCYLALRRTLIEAGLDHASTLETAKADCLRLYEAIDSRRRSDVNRASEKFAGTMGEILRRKELEIVEIEAKFPPRLTAIATARERALDEADAKYPPLLQRLEDQYTAKSEAIRQDHARAMAESRARYERDWAEMAGRWRSGLERFRAGVKEIADDCQRLFPDWNTEDWSRWKPAAEIPAAVRFGQAEIKLDKIRGGVPKDERLRPAQTDFSLPLLLPLPQHSTFLFKAADDGRARAVESIQAIMLRLLTALPPGKVRFTIFDPVGLGENFSAFMHLADYDELLVNSRIWTDTDHIEQRLTDLTQHMENVIQLYLRNEFQSIQQYNAFAGEMAEPYRVLVVANFPANFTDTAAQRLKSIVASGARCGVFVLLSIDTRLPAPHHFNVADLETDTRVLTWKDGQFRWPHADYGPVVPALDKPPPAERFTEIVRAVGQHVKDVGRVEVPFRCVIPEEPAWWTADSRGGIDVPLGRAGAMKLQSLDLGRGTSQHVLISGKTGSGKSTLLHVLITNLALRYSPDEVELYLVDFKKGVEFKAYARYQLPHARVVAIESEREFGLSVLQRLDAELKTRGDSFRKLGVQDIKGFRNAQPDTKLPRILLMVDEFQELFVEDDRIAQEAGLLLDRLVRQGRAFGMHVFLGSQTLGGAYSLARTTIGQMAIRIALQCSEADAHLILSEDNSAARLLTRPGEAIYNDANGLYEGNHPFQIVWLSDDERDDYLNRVHQIAGRRNYRAMAPIVFEGNVPADPAENVSLRDWLAAAQWPDACPAAMAWLGSAVAIKEPTAATFARQSGSNLLMVGHREEASLGVMATALVSLAAQLSPGKRLAQALVPADSHNGARFYILDGIRPEAPEAGFWQRVVRAVPHGVTIAEPRDVPRVMTELSAEICRRQQDGHDGRFPPIYLFIYNMSRFRDLRKEDDYSFGNDDKPASPGKQFATLLREGPALGIHTIAWCDSYSTVSRLLDRQSLRDFDMRVLFQMNATDSSSLMDSPDAAKLGVHRAIFYDEGHGQIEKFRPYGLPPSDWLEAVRNQLHGRCLGGN